MRVSEIRVNQIRVNQGLGVFIRKMFFRQLASEPNQKLLARLLQKFCSIG